MPKRYPELSISSRDVQDPGRVKNRVGNTHAFFARLDAQSKKGVHTGIDILTNTLVAFFHGLRQHNSSECMCTIIERLGVPLWIFLLTDLGTFGAVIAPQNSV